MKTNLNKKIVKIFMVTLILGVTCFPVCSVTQDLPPQLQSIKTEIPHKDSSGNLLLKKFLIAMLGVACSTLALYLLLTLYNKFRTNLVKKSNEQAVAQNKQSCANSFERPANVEDAIEKFLQKMD